MSNNAHFSDRNELSRIIHMNRAQQILLGASGTQVLHVVEDLPDESSLADDLGGEGQVLIIQDEPSAEPSEIAVWNSEKGEYELLSADFNEFAHQILDILDQENEHQSKNLDTTEYAKDVNETFDSSHNSAAPAEKETTSGRAAERMEIGENHENPDQRSSAGTNSNGKQNSTVIQLETATGRIIQLPGEDDHVDASNETFPNESPSEEEEDESTELPFACTLCKKRFSRKLHLNNHMERHHGIKFVFTEKGRKVKLVRIPEGFRIVEGEKLDPCVEKLITTIDKEKLHSIIGVEEIEPDETEVESQIADYADGKDGVSNEPNHLADLLHGKKEGKFGCGFLFKKIATYPYRVAMEKGEAPFAAFYPNDRNSVYLFRVVQIGDKHLVLPATKKDVKNAMGAKRDGENYVIPLVAALRITEGQSGKLKMTLGPLPPLKPAKVEILPFEEFAAYARMCQDKTVKSLADSTEASPSPNKPPIVVEAAPKFRKKFQRRTSRACNRDATGMKTPSELCTGNQLDTPVSRAKKEMKNRERVTQSTKVEKLRRNLRKEFDDEMDDDDDDDEEKDASYYPRDRRPKKRGRGRPPGTKNRAKVL